MLLAQGHLFRAIGINRFHNFTVLLLWLASLETVCHTLFRIFRERFRCKMYIDKTCTNFIYWLSWNKPRQLIKNSVTVISSVTLMIMLLLLNLSPPQPNLHQEERKSCWSFGCNLSNVTKAFCRLFQDLGQGQSSQKSIKFWKRGDLSAEWTPVLLKSCSFYSDVRT